MGLKGIFLAILIIYTIYLWWRVRKKTQNKSHKLIHWVMGGIAVYYGISTLIMIIGSDWCVRIQTWMAVFYPEKRTKYFKIAYCNRGRMGLVLVLMMFISITLLGLWEKKRSRKRFQEAVRKLRELEAMTLTEAIK